MKSLVRMVIALLVVPCTGCGAASSTGNDTLVHTTDATSTTSPVADAEPVSFTFGWPMGMRWRTVSAFDQQVRSADGRNGSLRVEFESVDTVLATDGDAAETHQRLESYTRTRNGQPQNDPELVAAIGSVVRVVWTRGRPSGFEVLSGAPDVGRRILRHGQTGGAPPGMPVRIGERGSHTEVAGEHSYRIEHVLTSLDRAAGTAVIEGHAETDQLPDGQTVRLTIDLRCTVEFATALPLRIEVTTVLRAARMDTVAHLDVRRERL